MSQPIITHPTSKRLTLLFAAAKQRRINCVLDGVRSGLFWGGFLGGLDFLMRGAHRSIQGIPEPVFIAGIVGLLSISARLNSVFALSLAEQSIESRKINSDAENEQLIAAIQDAKDARTLGLCKASAWAMFGINMVAVPELVHNYFLGHGSMSHSSLVAAITAPPAVIFSSNLLDNLNNSTLRLQKILDDEVAAVNPADRTETSPEPAPAA